MDLVLGTLLVLVVVSFWFARKPTGKLRVLMYHKIDPTRQDMLTVSTSQLEQHLLYLQNEGFVFLPLQNLLHLSSPPANGIILTFDDAYLNNLTYAYPILKKYNTCATIFVPTAYVNGTNAWDLQPEPLLSLEQLRQLDSEIFSLGLHSHRHQHYGKLSVEEISNDLTQNIAFFHQNNLEFIPAFAYPYGGRPKSKIIKKQMQQQMKHLGIEMAFRIGNRLNAWPLRNRYEIQRIDIRGTDSFEDFKRKVRWGKLI
ncbi:MAG: polysaccharide deacetylase family protein [Runella sp.]